MRYSLLMLSLLGFISPPIYAEEQRCMDTGMFFDNNLPDSKGLVFDDEDTWLPRPGDFELVNYYLMSNVCGERWALVTVKNISAGTSTLKGEHIVALMANGEKRQVIVEKRIKGHETESFTINYGVSMLPVINILVRTK